MGKLIERLREFKEKQLKKSILRKAEKGFRKEQSQKLSQIRLEEKTERLEEKTKQIIKIRKAQAERIPKIKLKKKRQFQRRQPPKRNIGLGTSFRVV